ncbi:Aquaporin-3 [Caenorhabditis elegans]|uniref:Aquaporin-3 n=2 Tax=Caenorhabditis elegans TaxID=6239 RepID=Q9XW36_CAEEL|nr:Aquaporin-3 [Caenorhabditis elegans]CAA22259.1 Aquaporin-3 [Caenorhabditis elegans]|eukprot:NP_502044.1 AQuaPorin or aquaglyceroporin related [Caenorhabditis elegans]
MLSDSSCSSSDRSFKFPFDTTDALSIHELAVKDLPKPDAENPFSVAMHSPPGSPPFAVDRKSVDNSVVAVTDTPFEFAPSQKSSQHTNRPPPFVKPEEEMMYINHVERLKPKFAIGNELIRAFLAELFCTGFLVFGGECVNAQYVLSQGKNNEWIGISVGWGLVLMLAVLMGSKISGAHLNPAVSFFQLTQGKINLIRFLVYAVAQNIGAFLGAFGVFCVYYDAINVFEGGNRTVTGPTATASIFATYPGPFLGTFNAIVDQIAGTLVLCLGVAAITDRRNGIPAFLQPAWIGALLAFLGMSLALNAGYAINPARDFAPRLFNLCAGYGWEVFSYRNYKWFWIPIICPMIGGVLGAWLYEFFIGFHIQDEDAVSLDSESDKQLKTMIDNMVDIENQLPEYTDKKQLSDIASIHQNPSLRNI